MTTLKLASNVILDIRLLGNIPVSHVVHVVGAPYMLAGNTSNSLAGSEEQINFSQHSPKMLKMASESFILALLLFLGLFFEMSCWVPFCRPQVTN